MKLKRILGILAIGLVLTACAATAAQVIASLAAPPLSLDSAPINPLPDPALAPVANALAAEPQNAGLPAAAETAPAEASQSGLTQEPPAPSPEPLPSPTPYRYGAGPEDFPDDVNPLTGLPASDPALLERRPMTIKVTNYPRSVRPQWGLSQADQVFEYYIGDHMSRFIGVFYGRDASRVGPIRSARLFDEYIMRMYNAIFVFGYADDPILERLEVPDLKKRLVVERRDNCPPVCRIGPKYQYNTLYTDTHLLSQYITDRGTNNERQDLTGLRFELDTPPSGNPGERFSIQYTIVSYNKWEYDPASERYLRYQDAQDDRGEKAYEPLIDSLTGEQLSADNVVVLFMEHTYFLRSSSTTIVDMVFSGQGSGYAFRNGQVYPITWTHADSNRVLSLYLPDGRHYPLKPGNVWFEALGQTTTFTPLPDGSYDFQFQIP